MNIINWIRQPALLWTFAPTKSELGRDFFYAPSGKQARKEIIHHMRMNHGDEIGELRWQHFDLSGDGIHVLNEYDDDTLVSPWGYLKLVNGEVKTLDEIMENYVQLSVAEMERKQRRIDAYLKSMENPRNTDSENYYDYNPEFAPVRTNPTFSENQFEE